MNSNQSLENKYSSQQDKQLKLWLELQAIIVTAKLNKNQIKFAIYKTT